MTPLRLSVSHRCHPATDSITQPLVTLIHSPTVQSRVQDNVSKLVQFGRVCLIASRCLVGSGCLSDSCIISPLSTYPGWPHILAQHMSPLTTYDTRAPDDHSVQVGHRGHCCQLPGRCAWEHRLLLMQQQQQWSCTRCSDHILRINASFFYFLLADPCVPRRLPSL